MEDSPHPEFQQAIKTLVKLFQDNTEDGQLKDGQLKDKLNELKENPKFQAMMKRRMGGRKKCNAVGLYCRLVGMKLRQELGKEESDDECD